MPATIAPSSTNQRPTSRPKRAKPGRSSASNTAGAAATSAMITRANSTPPAVSSQRQQLGADEVAVAVAAEHGVERLEQVADPAGGAVDRERDGEQQADTEGAAGRLGQRVHLAGDDRRGIGRKGVGDLLRLASDGGGRGHQSVHQDGRDHRWEQRQERVERDAGGQQGSVAFGGVRPRGADQGNRRLHCLDAIGGIEVSAHRRACRKFFRLQWQGEMSSTEDVVRRNVRTMRAFVRGDL